MKRYQAMAAATAAYMAVQATRAAVLPRWRRARSGQECPGLGMVPGHPPVAVMA